MPPSKLESLATLYWTLCRCCPPPSHLLPCPKRWHRDRRDRYHHASRRQFWTLSSLRCVSQSQALLVIQTEHSPTGSDNSVTRSPTIRCRVSREATCFRRFACEEHPCLRIRNSLHGLHSCKTESWGDCHETISKQCKTHLGEHLLLCHCVEGGLLAFEQTLVQGGCRVLEQGWSHCQLSSC